MVTIAIVMFGLVAITRLPINLLPDITYPTFVVEAAFPGASPMEVENLVARPIEEAVGVLPGVHRIRSRSTAGLAQVTIEFGWGTNLDLATMDVREKLDLLVLPEEVDKPLILKYDPLSDPILRLSFRGNAPLSVLRTFADRTIKRNLETIPGVAAVKVLGGQDREIHVVILPDRLRVLGVTLEDVETALAQHNVNIAGGSLYQNDARFTVRALNQMLTPEDAGNVPVKIEATTPVYLKDVADVSWGYQRPEAMAATEEGPSIELAIYREGDANVVALSKRIQRYLPSLDKLLPPETSLDTLFDASSYIKDAISEVRSNAVVGGLIAIAILFFFLGSFRATLAVGLSIPISIIATFFLMDQFGITLNLMSLGGLALGVGMLVDNAIVVIEAIERRAERGSPFPGAAIEGTGEIAGAITASTLTTVAVFLPVLFLKGFAAQMFRDEALTVTFALLASLVVALSLIPMLTARLSGNQKRKGFFPASIAERYQKFLGPVVRRPGLTVFLFLALFLAAVFMARNLQVDLLPPLHQGTLILNAKLPPGTRLESTDVFARELIAFAKDLPGVTDVFATSGRWQRGSQPEEERGENTTEIYFKLKGRDISVVEENLQSSIAEFLSSRPRLTYTFTQPTLLSFSTPIEIEIIGSDLDDLQHAGETVLEALASQPFLKDVQSTATKRSPEIQVSFLPARLAFYGLTFGEVAEAIRKQVEGTIATKLDVGEEEIGVRVKTFEGDVLEVDALAGIKVGRRGDKDILLSQVAKVEKGLGPSEIQRVGQRRVVTVTANLRGIYLSGAVSQIQTVLDQLHLPAGVQAVVSGANLEMQESFRGLLLAFLLAVFCVYVVMASQFESFLHPFIILFTVPLGIIGAIFTLTLLGLQVNVIVLIGIVMLSGIVVNNGIVMVDTANQLRRGGLSPEKAVIEAAGLRFRPILMTALTTILGLLPLSLGMGPGAELKAPLGITVVGGLSFATLLTLFFIPALYKLFTRK